MDYRLLLLSPLGRAERFIFFKSENDEAAMAIANRHAQGRAVELWSFSRLVMRKPNVDAPAPRERTQEESGTPPSR